MDQVLIQKRIHYELMKQFNLECPESDIRHITDKRVILNEYRKWYNFWDSKRPNLSNPNIKLKVNAYYLQIH